MFELAGHGVFPLSLISGAWELWQGIVSGEIFSIIWGSLGLSAPLSSFESSKMVHVKPELPAVCAYHAEIRVQRGDDVLILQVDRPDWAPESEVLRDEAMERGLETVGDLVVALESEGKVRTELKSAGNFFGCGLHQMWERLV